MALAGFWCALADATTSLRITGSEVQFMPGPSKVEYPSEFLGQILETADGNAIQQQPTKDPRRRSWVWESYPYYKPAYQRLWASLNDLRARYRQGLTLSPYVYLLDSVTGEFRRKVDYVGTVASASSSTFTPSAPVYAADAFKGSNVVFTTGAAAGLRQFITTNAANGLITLGGTLPATPAGGDAFVISYWVNDWFRVRVVDVNRTLADSGIVKYATSKLTFVIDDPNWDYLG